MKESPFGFEYSWADLEPVRPLMVVVLVAQLVGALIGLWLAKLPGAFENLWTGAAIATFPGFIIGIPIQTHLLPGSLGVNKVMVGRMGFVALLLTVAAVFIPPGS